MKQDSPSNLVKAGLRSVAASFAGFASVAQAWNEAEAMWRNDRTDRFFAQVADDMLLVKERIIAMERDLTPRRDLPALLERTVEKIQREASDEKIRRFARLLTNTIVEANTVSYDDGVNCIETLDSLTDQDIAVLAHFKQHQNIRVDSLVQDGVFNWAPIGQKAPGGANYSKMSRMIVSLSKLESRGIIGLSVEAGGMIATSGDRQHWYNQWKVKSFELLPFGAQFIRLIEE